MFFTIIALALTSPAAVGSSDCVEKVLSSKVVRIDEDNKRYFNVNKEISVANFQSKLDALRECHKGSDWEGEWSISVFAEETHANYKDEADIIPLHNNNAWAESGLLDYDETAERLIVSPAL